MLGELVLQPLKDVRELIDAIPRPADTLHKRVVQRHVVRLRPPPQLRVIAVVTLHIPLHPFELLPRQFR
jgi:hypothetical protein